jgi:predicted O-linked N-acetylglucosamine transferase (SPINDLY family)
LESSAQELGPLLLQDETKFNECVQPLQATMMPVQDPLLFLTLSSSFWGKFWESLYKSEHATVDATQPLITPVEIMSNVQSRVSGVGSNTIAYVSSNFQGGAVWYMIQGLLADHLHLNSSRVSVFSTAAIDAKGPSMSVLRRLPVLDASNMIHTDTVIAIRRSAALVAIDINGFTEKPALQIFRFRVAPVQMTWMGYPGSLHLENMDYLVGDATATPVEHAWAMKEKLALLSQTYYLNDMRAQMPVVGGTPPLARHVDAVRQAHDLPIQIPGGGPWSNKKRPILLMCFNRLIKIDKVIFSCWMAAMRAQPRALLWLLNEAKSQVTRCRPLHF